VHIEAPQSDGDDARLAPRASLYLAAVLSCDGTHTSVKIRNISSSGALLEGAQIPEVGSSAKLTRGNLSAEGFVAWATERKCGLKFSAPIKVQQWRASTLNTEQARIDDIVRQLNAGIAPSSAADPNEDFVRLQNTELSDHLGVALALLEALSEVIAGDAEMVLRNGAELQKLDIAMQLIAAISLIMSGRSESVSDASARLSGLRRSADQALK
jgi:hypothetical protein